MSIKLKSLEGQRLYRALRYFFKKRQFQFAWTNGSTSYFDGKTVHIIYDVQRSHLKSFSKEEERIVRLGHAYHEVGHFLFDHLQSYLDWQKVHATRDKKEWNDDWATHKKYPQSWLQFFGNFGLDGRMEHLLKLYYAPTTDYLDYVNHHWVYPVDFKEKAGKSPLQDFRTLYGCAVLDVDVSDTEFHPEAVALLDSQSELMEEINQQNSTQLCLEVISTIMENTWPTILEWIEQEKEDCSDDNSFSGDMTSGQWSDNEQDTAENTDTSREVDSQKEKEQKEEQSSDDNNEKKGKDFSRIIHVAQREQSKDEDEAAAQEADEAKHTISYHSGTDEDAKVDIKPLPFDENLEHYQKRFIALQPNIKNMARELKQLVAPIHDQQLRRQKRGRLMARDVWRTIHCNDSHINQVTIKGVPGKDVFINIMADVSGSTGFSCNGRPIIEDIQDSIITIIEATNTAKIQSRAFAFTTDMLSTQIFKLKTRANTITDFNKGNIGSLRALSGNRDVVALRYLIDDTKVEKVPIKIAFMISDGSPNFFEGEDENTISDLVLQGKQLGIHVLCVFVGDDEYGLACAKRMYGNRVIHAKKGIAREMQHQIKQLLK